MAPRVTEAVAPRRLEVRSGERTAARLAAAWAGTEAAPVEPEQLAE